MGAHFIRNLIPQRPIVPAFVLQWAPFVVVAGAPDLLEDRREPNGDNNQTAIVVYHKIGGSDALILKIITALILKYGQLDCHGSVEFIGVALVQGAATKCERKPVHL